MTSDESSQTQQLFTVFCGESACGRPLKILPQSIKRVVRSGLEATVTVDLSPAKGQDPVRACGRETCGLSFASATTKLPTEITWLEERVPAERIDNIDDESVIVLQRRQ